MKSVYVMTDLEGVAGVVTFGVQTGPDGRYYEQARKLLTGEVNAAVEGMVEEGVEDILIGDMHGPGAVSFEDLHPKAKLLHGRPLGQSSVIDEALEDYEACMILGQHAMAGTPTGNLNHTQSSATVDYYKLNGRPIGEIAQFALYEGSFGRPVIFLSGDEAACREAEELIPGIITVAVKKGVGRNSAISLSAAEARSRIREGVRRAVREHRESPILPLQWDPPFVLEKRYFHTDSADAAASRPDVERVDSQTVRLRSPNIRDIIYR
jgi:D-amino peptidase